MNKTMEKEYKWRADELLLNRALLWASSRIGSQSRTIRMESSYFDTADGMMRNKKAALRLRRENERTVCCMKLRNTDTPDGMRAHEEYQRHRSRQLAGRLNHEVKLLRQLCSKRVEGILAACDILQFDLAQRRRFTVMTQFAFVKRHFAHGIALLQQNRTPAE